MEFEIRRATRDDVPAVRRVARDAWHAAYDEILGARAVETAVENWYDAEGLAESIARDDGRFLVAEDARSSDTPEERASGTGGEVVGFAQGVLGDDDGPAWLPRIYVHPDRWGEGVGATLLGRIEGWLREAEALGLRLAVFAGNDVGNAFYDGHGYEVVEEREEELFDATFAEYVREKEL